MALAFASTACSCAGLPVISIMLDTDGWSVKRHLRREILDHRGGQCSRTFTEGEAWKSYEGNISRKQAYL